MVHVIELLAATAIWFVVLVVLRAFEADHFLYLLAGSVTAGLMTCWHFRNEIAATTSQGHTT